MAHKACVLAAFRLLSGPWIPASWKYRWEIRSRIVHQEAKPIYGALRSEAGAFH